MAAPLSLGRDRPLVGLSCSKALHVSGAGSVSRKLKWVNENAEQMPGWLFGG